MSGRGDAFPAAGTAVAPPHAAGRGSRCAPDSLRSPRGWRAGSPAARTPSGVAVPESAQPAAPPSSPGRVFESGAALRAAVAFLVLALAGCGGPGVEPGLVFGEKGAQDGNFSRPRAAAIDRSDRLFVVDMTARIQAFDLDGHYLGPTWTTPDYRNGRPSGLGLDRDGNLLVADSHYHTVRTYDAAGNELRFFGGVAGTEPGQLSYVSDAIQDTDGFYYVTEFGEVSRVSKFDADGKFVRCWGTEGESAGEFRRPRALTLGPDGLVYVADACNHRVQAFTRDGELRRCWGEPGPAPGKLQYPYDLAFGPDGNLYVAEYGNSRVQKFTPDGKSLGTWGGPGRAPGRLANPWALAVDRHGRVFVIDSDNHRVQRISW